MSDKPKRWTWEEWEEKRNSRDRISPFHIDKFMFHANEPLLDWQEKEIKCLGKTNSEASDMIVKQFEENKELKQRIAELEHELGRSCDFCEKSQETIARLREALEFYADCNNWVKNNRKINYCDNESFGTFRHYGGKLARTALKEIFGEEE